MALGLRRPGAPATWRHFAAVTACPRVRQGSGGGQGSAQGESAAPFGARDVSILSSSSWELS